MITEPMTQQALTAVIDQTLLRPDATLSQLEAFCAQAKEYAFGAICVSSAMAHITKQLLGKTDVRLCATVGFPHGQTTVDTKVFETRGAMLDGADEIDYVVNLVYVKSGDFKAVEREMRHIVSVCHRYDRLVKVIFENCCLTQAEKETLCRIALDVRPDFIKTSTGFGAGNATVEDVRLMKRIVGDAIGVKASGGIRTLEDAQAMIAAGAARIGTSAGAAIVDQFRAQC